MDRLIYHITHINNLQSILEAGGLWCDAQRISQGLDCENIAHGNIKERRMRTPVPIAPGGRLTDYVPFYFSNRTPMLYAINTGCVEGLPQGSQSSIIYLVSSVETVAGSDKQWCFTDGHAVEAMSSFYNSASDLTEVDWDVINSWSWKERLDDMDRKRRKQAEFLVHNFFEWDLFLNIGVFSREMKSNVEQLVSGQVHTPLVSVESNWYYN